MKQKKELSPRRQEAARLCEQLMHIDINYVDIPYTRKLSFGGERTDVDRFVIGVVNGVKYIQKGCCGYDVSAFLNKMERNGTVTQEDYIHAIPVKVAGVIHREKVVAMLKAEVFLSLKDELAYYMKHITFSEVYMDQVQRAYQALDTEGLTENFIEEETIRENETIYHRMIELRRETKRLEKETPDTNGDVPFYTLEELVAMIEERGWEVTLRINREKWRSES